jgi:hypothetical protein
MMPMVGLLFAASLYTRRHTLGPVVMRKLRGQNANSWSNLHTLRKWNVFRCAALTHTFLSN